MQHGDVIMSRAWGRSQSHRRRYEGDVRDLCRLITGGTVRGMAMQLVALDWSAGREGGERDASVLSIRILDTSLALDSRSELSYFKLLAVGGPGPWDRKIRQYRRR